MWQNIIISLHKEVFPQAPSFVKILEIERKNKRLQGLSIIEKAMFLVSFVAARLTASCPPQSGSYIAASNHQLSFESTSTVPVASSSLTTCPMSKI